jgi:hypothetical protein
MQIMVKFRNNIGLANAVQNVYANFVLRVLLRLLRGLAPSLRQIDQRLVVRLLNAIESGSAQCNVSAERIHILHYYSATLTQYIFTSADWNKCPTTSTAA